MFVFQLEWNMKLWWPHCEALIAYLMALQSQQRACATGPVQADLWLHLHACKRCFIWGKALSVWSQEVQIHHVLFWSFLTRNTASGLDIWTVRERLCWISKEDPSKVSSYGENAFNHCQTWSTLICRFLLCDSYPKWIYLFEQQSILHTPLIISYTTIQKFGAKYFRNN